MTTDKATAAADNVRLGSIAAGAGESVANAAGLVEFISFAIGDDQYGVDIMAVHEIKGWTEVTYLPKQPDYVRGVLNLRGIMVPIIDLRCRFGEGLTETTPLHVMIVVQIDARQVGLLADRVLDIISIDASKIQAVPNIAQTSQVDFLSGLVTVDATMIALIDLSHLLVMSELPDGSSATGVVAAAA